MRAKLVAACAVILSACTVEGPQGPPGIEGPQGPAGTVRVEVIGDGGFRLGGDVNINGVQGPAGPKGDIGPQGPQGPQGPAGQATGGPRIVDANGTTVGPVFSLGTTYGALGYTDAAKNIWVVDLEDGELSGMQTIGYQVTWTLYLQSNCGGPGYLQLGCNGCGSRPAMMNAVFKRDTEYRVRKGAIVSTLPSSVLSTKSFSGTCSNVTGTPFEAGYGPYILASNTAVVTKPTNSWALPLRFAF